MDCYITAKALKFKIAKLGLSIIITAPKWNAMVYNESNKNMMDQPYEIWTKKFLMHRAAEGAKKEVIEHEETKETKMIAGLKTHKVIVKKQRGGEGKILPVAEVWVAPEIKAPPQFYAMMEAMGAKTGNSAGAPLRLTTFNYTHGMITGRVSGLECMQAKKTQIPASAFALLTGYKKVTDEMALMMDEGDQDMMGGGAAATGGGSVKPGASGVKAGAGSVKPGAGGVKSNDKTSDDMSSLFGEIGKSLKKK